MRKPDIIAPPMADDTDEGEVDFSEAPDDDDEEQGVCYRDVL